MPLNETELEAISDKLGAAHDLITEAGIILANRRVLLDPATTPPREIGRMVSALSNARQYVTDVESAVYRALNEDRKGGELEIEYSPSTCQPARIKATIRSD
jgi:hypothetical protein